MQSSDLTSDEAEIIAYYRSMSPAMRDHILGQAKDMATVELPRLEQKKQEKGFIFGELFEVAVFFCV